MIESISNPKVQRLRSLYNKKARTSSGLFVIEGTNILKDIPSDIKIVELFVSQSRQDAVSEIVEHIGVSPIVLSDSLFSRVCETVTPSGLVAIARRPGEFDWKKADRLMILDGVSDSGNVGTIIRTAAAVGFDGVLLFNSADPFGPKCVRSSMGGVFRIPIAESDYSTFDYDGKVYLLDMEGSNIFDYHPHERYSVVVGSEASGASAFFRERADCVLSLPMKNKTESLNAGVSAALAMYILDNNRR